MSKVLRVIIIMVIMLGVMFYSTSSYALNMNLENNSNVNSNTTENTANDVNTNTSTNTQTSDTSTDEAPQKSFTTQVTVSTQELTISNFLSICLIAVGIVLILLSIAILIKLKK